MATIGATRLDDRLIHGQVVARWMNTTKCNRILIIDDEVANSDFHQRILRLAAPKDIGVEIMSTSNAAAAWKKNELGEGTVFILFKTVGQLQKALDEGLGVKHVMIGGLCMAPGKKSVFRTIGLTEGEARMLKHINDDMKVTVVFHMIPEDAPSSLDSRLKKVFKNV